MASRSSLSSLFAPISVVSSYNKRKHKFYHNNFDFHDRSKHHTINNGCAGRNVKKEAGEMRECTEMYGQATHLMSGDGLPVDQDESYSDRSRKKDVFIVNFCGRDYACNSTTGRVIYFGCGRLVRRALHNPSLFFAKMALSTGIFFGCWYTMHFGGALATWKFPRTDQHDKAEPLPDLVMDWFGDPADLEVCSHRDDWWMPGADMALTLNLFLTLVEAFAGQHGHVHLQRALHMSAIVFLCRTSVVGLTGLNQPNERCLPIQDVPMTYSEALSYVFSTFPHRSCGDLIYSGHTALLVTWLLNFRWQNGIVHSRWWLTLWCWVQSLWGISLLIICRSHYTVDVALGSYFAYFVTQFYMVRALNVFQGGSLVGSAIQRLEYWGDDWEKAGKLPFEIEDDDDYDDDDDDGKRRWREGGVIDNDIP